MSLSFHKERDRDSLEKLDFLLANELPGFVGRFFLGIQQTKLPLTRLSYARDLVRFFEFLYTQVEAFQDLKPQTTEIAHLENLEVQDIELYVKTMDGKSSAHIQRNLCTLRSFFKYLFKQELITKNILPNIDLPKVRDKTIIKLEPNEVGKLIKHLMNDEIDVAETGYQRENRLRNSTIIIVFLCTGLRVSELVGLNIGDIDLENACIKVIRKGGISTILYIPDDCEVQLGKYLNSLDVVEANRPLFMGNKKSRITPRAVQDIVKKYANLVAPLKNISPHKLRSTFGTNLYRETGDIYVVADVLGHRDVNTTKKHYAALSDDIRKEATRKIKVFPDHVPK